MPQLTPPPVPAKLREMLKDYPEYIARLQEALDGFIAKPKPRLMPFDEAIWALEGRFETFIAEAREELKSAEASQDASAIEKARKKELVMLHARGLHGLHDLRAYFQANKEAFE